MYLVDNNVLIASAMIEHPHHTLAGAWTAEALKSARPFGLPLVVALGFVRIVTQGRIFSKPLTAKQAGEWLDVIYRAPGFVQPEPSPQHMRAVIDLLTTLGTAGNLVNDAHLAALAIEHGATLVSFDRDFLRFPGLQLHLLG